uniref:Uncharacterized protein n=1 Tax=Timema shepardi TaxID=629360 RepID=A0A7R9B6R3_TIMSH|nr:unnamed protein product [Timema shepardi]
MRYLRKEWCVRSRIVAPTPRPSRWSRNQNNPSEGGEAVPVSADHCSPALVLRGQPQWKHHQIPSEGKSRSTKEVGIRGEHLTGPHRGGLCTYHGHHGDDLRMATDNTCTSVHRPRAFKYRD